MSYYADYIVIHEHPRRLSQWELDLCEAWLHGLRWRAAQEMTDDDVTPQIQLRRTHGKNGLAALTAVCA
jgi:hypothetical protein